MEMAELRRLVGDKLAGRHGNKGVIAKYFQWKICLIWKTAPRLILFKPLGVVSRMNIGQILKLTGLGSFQLLSGDYSSMAEQLKKKERVDLANIPEMAKYPCLTAEAVNNGSKVTVGIMYVMN